MEVSVVVPIWELIVLVVMFAGSYAVVVFMTKQNAKEIATHKREIVKEVEQMRKTFVTAELYNNEVQHINNTLSEIKNQNTQILALLASNKNRERIWKE